jgi:hypothetical protein
MLRRKQVGEASTDLLKLLRLPAICGVVLLTWLNDSGMMVWLEVLAYVVQMRRLTITLLGKESLGLPSPILALFAMPMA